MKLDVRGNIWKLLKREQGGCSLLFCPGAQCGHTISHFGSVRSQTRDDHMTSDDQLSCTKIRESLLLPFSPDVPSCFSRWRSGASPEPRCSSCSSPVLRLLIWFLSCFKSLCFISQWNQRGDSRTTPRRVFFLLKVMFA